MYVLGRKKGKSAKKSAPRARRMRPPPSGKKVALPVAETRRTERVPTSAECRAAFFAAHDFGELCLLARGVSVLVGRNPEEVYERVASEFERIGDFLFPPAPRHNSGVSRVKKDGLPDEGNS